MPGGISVPPGLSLYFILLMTEPIAKFKPPGEPIAAAELEKTDYSPADVTRSIRVASRSLKRFLLAKLK